MNTMNTPKNTINSITSINENRSNRIINLGDKLDEIKVELSDEKPSNSNPITKRLIQDIQNLIENDTPKNQSFVKIGTSIRKKDVIDRAATKNFQNIVTSLVDDNYFKEDIKSRRKQQFINAQNDKSQSKSFFEQFHFKYFLEFFLYHAIYFLMLGPLAIPLINLRGKALSRNMSFSGLNYSSVQQFIMYLLNICTFAVFYTKENKVISFQVEIINVIGIMLTRCLVIACKYATYDPLKMKVFRCTILTWEQKKADLFFLAWARQTPEVIHYQVYQCQRAFDIDPSLFFVQFMIDPEQKTHDRLINHDQILLKVRSTDQYCEIRPFPIAREKKGEKFYFGYAILKDLIDSYQFEYRKYRQGLIIFVIIFAISRALIPVGVRIYDNPTNPYINAHEYFIGALSFFQVGNMFMFLAMQSALGFFDTARKLFMQRQLSFIIAPRKLKNLDMNKILPTINIFNSGTMKGWTLIRKVCMEYGKGFSLRVQGIFTFLGLWCLGCLTVLVLYYFQFIGKIEKGFELQIYADAIVSIVLIFALIITGAQINDVFDLQESILNANKTILSDLNLVVKGLLNEQYHSQSFIYTKALEKILEQDQDNPEEQIESLLQHYDFHINELLHDKKHNPFTLFGIKVTFLMLQSVAVAIGSVVATLLSQLNKK